MVSLFQKLKALQTIARSKLPTRVKAVFIKTILKAPVTYSSSSSSSSRSSSSSSSSSSRSSSSSSSSNAQAIANAKARALADAKAKAIADAKAKAEAERIRKEQARLKAIADAKARREAVLKMLAEAKQRAINLAKAKALRQKFLDKVEEIKSLQKKRIELARQKREEEDKAKQKIIDNALAKAKQDEINKQTEIDKTKEDLNKVEEITTTVNTKSYLGNIGKIPGRYDNVVFNKKIDPKYSAPVGIDAKSGYTYGTGTEAQLIGGEGGHVPRKQDEGFYKPSVVDARIEKMSLDKQHYIGRDPDTKEPTYVKKTSYSVIHDYEPGFDDPKQKVLFDKAESDITSNLSIAESNIETINRANEQIPLIHGYVKQLEGLPGDTNVTYSIIDTTGKSTEKTVPASEALVFFKSQLDTLATDVSKLPTAQKNVQSLKYQKELISGYREHGYKLEETDTGYSITTPTATEVFTWKHGKQKGSTLKASASLLSSPLGIQSFGAGIHELITSDPEEKKKIREAEQERLSEYSLGLDASLKRGDYFAHVVGSPAMIEGVYIPALTLGASSVLSTGASAISPYVSSGAGKIGTTVGKVIPTTLKLVVSDTKPLLTTIAKGTGKVLSTPGGKLGVKYGLFAGMQGSELLETASQRPETIGGVFSRSLFNWELQWASMESGFKDTKLPTQKKDFIGSDIKARTNIPGSVKKTDVVGRFDVVQTKKPTDILFKGKIFNKGDDVAFKILDIKNTDDFIFGGSGRALVKQEGSKTVIGVDVSGKGIGRTTRDVMPGLDYTEASGNFKFSWAEKKGFTKVTHTSFRPIKSDSFIVGKTDDMMLLHSASKTPGKLEHTIGESFTSIKKIKDVGESTISGYYSKGDFSNILDDVVGKQKFFGLSTSIKGGGAESVDVGKKLATELVSVTKTATFDVGGSLTKVAVGSSKKVPILTGARLITSPSGGVSPGTSKTVSVSKADTISTLPTTSSILVSKTKPVKATKYFSPTKGSTLLSGSILDTKSTTKQGTQLISITDTKQSSRTDQKSGLGLITGEMSILDTKSNQKLGTGLIVDTGLDLTNREDYFTLGVQIQNIDIMQTQDQQQGLISRTTQKQAQMFDTELSTITTIQTTPVNPTIPKIPFFYLPGDDPGNKTILKGKKGKGQGYNVLVKERSMFHGKITKPTKFKKRNIAPVSRKKALAIGATLTDNSPAISFKITKAKGKAKASLQNTKSFDSLKHKFKKKGKVYIEKNKFRLDSPGEQRGISLLGRQSQNKNMLSKKSIGSKKKSKKKKGKKNVPYI